jgi:hypothetical protein
VKVEEEKSYFGIVLSLVAVVIVVVGIVVFLKGINK